MNETKGKGNVSLIEGSFSAGEYARLRNAVGWWPVEPNACRQGLVKGLYCVRAERGNELVGCGRIVGDGGIYFYIQDVIVLPAYQNLGIGSSIMDALMDYLSAHARNGAFIGMMAARGKARFYERWGFERRPDDGPGMYRVWDQQVSTRAC